MASSNSLWGETISLPGSRFTNHFAIAYLVLSFVTFFGILYALWRSRDGNDVGSDARLRASAFSLLVKSTILFLLTYAFQILDIFLHEEQARVKEGYFFTYIFSDGWWQLGDLMVLTIACRISYYQFPVWEGRPVFHVAWQLLCMVSLTTLAALALYRWGVSTAQIILTLNGASSYWTHRFVHEAAVLGTGYHILYMLVSTFIVSMSVYYLGRRTRFRERFNKVEGQFFAVAILLWIKSVARAAIVLRYALDGVTRPAYLDTASEALYGLPTVAIYLLFNHLNLSDSLSEAKSDILREGRRTARRELMRRRIDASKGGPALPTPTQLLTEIEKQPLLYFPDQAQRIMSSLTDNEVQDTLSTHIKDVLKLREKI